MDLFNLAADKFGVFLIVFSRVSGIFSMAPFFGSKNIPAYVKIGCALFVAIILTPVIIARYPAFIAPQTFLPLVGLIIVEFSIGLLIGFVSYLIFAAIQMAGGLVDAQAGFSIVSVLDPQSGTQVPLLGTFKYMLAMLLFLAINGHHVILAALSESFQRMPIGTGIDQQAVLSQVVNMFTVSFAFGFKIAMPVLVALFLLDVAFGIMARTVPQMNVFMVGMPAKILVALFVMALALPVFLMVVQIGFTGMYADVYLLLDALPAK